MNEARRREIDARLHEIAKSRGGLLTAEAVIEDAKDANSPLHDSFEWNVEIAAHHHWLATANRLINGYRVAVTVDNRTLNAPVFVRSPEESKRYIQIDRVANDREMALAVLRREAERVQAAIGRMQAVAAALGLSDQVEALDNDVRRVLEAIT